MNDKKGQRQNFRNCLIDNEWKVRNKEAATLVQKVDYYGKAKKEGQNECTGKRWTEEKVLLQRRWFQMFFVGDRTITILWQSSNLDEKEI